MVTEETVVGSQGSSPDHLTTMFLYLIPPPLPSLSPLPSPQVLM